MDAQRVLDFFRRRRNYFRQSLMSHAGQQVLSDLQQFCCASATTARGDSAHEMAIREGRRQVWLRIERALNLTPEEMLALTQQKDQP